MSKTDFRRKFVRAWPALSRDDFGPTPEGGPAAEAEAAVEAPRRAALP